MMEQFTERIVYLENQTKQEGFLRCQTPTSTVGIKAEGCRVKN